MKPVLMLGVVCARDKGLQTMVQTCDRRGIGLDARGQIVVQTMMMMKIMS